MKTLIFITAALMAQGAWASHQDLAYICTVKNTTKKGTTESQQKVVPKWYSKTEMLEAVEMPKDIFPKVAMELFVTPTLGKLVLAAYVDVTTKVTAGSDNLEQSAEVTVSTSQFGEGRLDLSVKCKKTQTDIEAAIEMENTLGKIEAAEQANR